MYENVNNILFATHLGCEIFASILIYILNSADPDYAACCALHDLDLFCLNGWVLANSVDLDRMLQETAFDQGPSCLLLIWDVKCLHVALYFILYSEQCRS